MKRFGGFAGLLLAGMLTACSGGTDLVMPDVGAKRLDVALSDIERAGVEDEVEVLGGGTFGVVDESNWVVCDQEPGAGGLVEGAPRLTVARECEDADALDPDTSTDGQEDGGATASAKPDVDEPDAASEEDTASADEPVPSFTMPRLVGMNLQDAQDKLQTLDSFLLTQTDATGLERFQMVDSGWQVCSQRPRAGVTVPIDRMVNLGVVKLRETC